MTEQTLVVTAPGRVFWYFRDLIDQLPVSYDRLGDPAVTRIRAARLRRKLKNETDVWMPEEQRVELSRKEATLIWAAIFEVLFSDAKDAKKRRAQRASNILFEAA